MYESAFSTPKNISFNETCDSYDNDCDNEYNSSFYSSKIDEGYDKDNDSYFPYSSTLNSTSYNCTGYNIYDCDDSNANLHPGSSCSRTGYTGSTYSWNSVTLSCDCTGGSIESSGGSSSYKFGVNPNAPAEETKSEDASKTSRTEQAPSSSQPSTAKFDDIIDEIADNRIKHTRSIYRKWKDKSH